MKRSPNPFDSLPNAWLDAAIMTMALLFLSYAAWILWPVFVACWLLFMW